MDSGDLGDQSMQVSPALSRPEVIDAYWSTCARSDEIVRGASSLDVLAAVPNPGENQLDSLRSILLHLIEETARHAGHADILREHLDGTTGV